MISISGTESRLCSPQKKGCEQNNRGELKKAPERFQGTDSHQEKAHKIEKGEWKTTDRVSYNPVCSQEQASKGSQVTCGPPDEVRTPASTVSVGQKNF